MADERNAPLNVVLCWHMHQPDYCDHLRNEFRLPWVYLHGIKDYVDMAFHLETTPDAKAVINFSPILLEQLDEYERQIRRYLDNHEPIRDPLLSALDMQVFPEDAEHRTTLVKACLRSNRQRQIERFPVYQRLARLAEPVIQDPACSLYLGNQYLADLVTWYHLAWLGESVRRTDTRVIQLLEQQCGYTVQQRRQLLEIIAALLSSIRHRYGELARSGRIELSMSPYAHPIMPLLKKFDAAREAMPDVHLPVLQCYPGGEERIDWHIQHGLKVFEQYFGIRPCGLWPSEGGISAEVVATINNAGFLWTATGENVLRNSLNASQADGTNGSVYQGFRLHNLELQLFARDDKLSDLIGFTYSDWHADDAVADLIHRLEKIGESRNNWRADVVSIIMDGENAWEYYPENGYYFLSTLYKRLTGHPGIRLTTYSEIIGSIPVRSLDRIVSGSWVYGTFSTWVGDPDKNHAWDILNDAKHTYDEARHNQVCDEGQLARIDRQLAACEGSDWFWWFGNYNPAQIVSDFEQLFRIHLVNLYQMLGREPPDYLSQVLARGAGTPERGGVIRPGSDDRGEKL